MINIISEKQLMMLLYITNLVVPISNIKMNDVKHSFCIEIKY